MEIHTMSFSLLCRESKAIQCQKLTFRPGQQGWSVYMGKFSPRSRRSWVLFIWAQSTGLARFPRSRLATSSFLPKNFDLGNRTSPASYMNASRFLRRKDLGNRASPIDLTYMKRPFIVTFKVYSLFVSGPLSVYHSGQRVPLCPHCSVICHLLYSSVVLLMILFLCRITKSFLTLINTVELSYKHFLALRCSWTICFRIKNLWLKEASTCICLFLLLDLQSF